MNLLWIVVVVAVVLSHMSLNVSLRLLLQKEYLQLKDF